VKLQVDDGRVTIEQNSVIIGEPGGIDVDFLDRTTLGVDRSGRGPERDDLGPPVGFLHRQLFSGDDQRGQDNHSRTTHEHEETTPS
jgi:hypothetical protein